MKYMSSILAKKYNKIAILYYDCKVCDEKHALAYTPEFKRGIYRVPSHPMSKQKTPPEIQAIHDELGIPAHYASSCGLDFQPDCQSLVATELDVFGRQPYLSESAFIAWQEMQKAASEDGIELQIVSAFRSADYQKNLLQRKLEAGQCLEDILKVNAAPGFSEHHSGCALDITTPDFKPLEEVFENSPAFIWLCEHGKQYGFSMSFPKQNDAGIAYEPWHWKYAAD